MIPKIIHYCWFGGKPEPEEVKKCIASWRRFCPDYIIKRWDESNYDINRCKYMADAYKEKKWAFVSDYARIDIIHTEGGIYLDTDVEVIKSFDELLTEKMFCGFESRDPVGFKKNMPIEYSVNLGLGYGAEKGHPYLKELMDLYQSLSFYNADGTLNLIACPRYQTQVLVKHGLIANNETQRLPQCIAYSPEYFCPKSNVTDRFLYPLDKSFSIHHFTVSWASDKDLEARNWKNKLNKFLPYWIASKIVSFIYKFR